MSYDQWKTASPYDDEPDPIEEGRRFLKRHKDDVELGTSEMTFGDLVCAYYIIEGLLDYIDENV